MKTFHYKSKIMLGIVGTVAVFGGGFVGEVVDGWV